MRLESCLLPQHRLVALETTQFCCSGNCHHAQHRAHRVRHSEEPLRVPTLQQLSHTSNSLHEESMCFHQVLRIPGASVSTQELQGTVEFPCPSRKLDLLDPAHHVAGLLRH